MGYYGTLLSIALLATISHTSGLRHRRQSLSQDAPQPSLPQQFQNAPVPIQFSQSQPIFPQRQELAKFSQPILPEQTPNEPKDDVKTFVNVSEPIFSSNSSTINSTTTTIIPIILPPVDKNVDLDSDGVLSLTEVQYAAFVHHGLSSSVVEALFNQVDKNRDGYLTSLEFNDIRSLVLAKAENAALRYLQNVDVDKNQLLSLSEAQAYILKEYGISNRDVERIWRLVVPSSSDEMDAVLFSKLRRRVRGMSIRLARQIMKTADLNEDGRIDLREAQMIAFEQEGISTGDVIEMLASVDDNADGELNAPEFADFERIVRARAIDTAKKALKVVDTDASGTLTMDEARKIAFDHYGFDERTLEPFFAQADENEDGQLDAVEFAGFRSVIRSRAVKNAQLVLPEYDTDRDGRVSSTEAEEKASRDDDLDAKETLSLFNVADQDRSNYLDRVELGDFIRLVRLSAIKYINDNFKDFDTNHDKSVTIDELEAIVKDKYNVDGSVTRQIFQRVDVDNSNDLIAGEIVDFRHEIRKHVAERGVQNELEAQNKKELAEIETKHHDEPKPKEETDVSALKIVTKQDETTIKTETVKQEPTTTPTIETTQSTTSTVSTTKKADSETKKVDDKDYEIVEVVEIVTDPPSTTTTTTQAPVKRTRIVKIRRPKTTTTPVPTTTQEYEEVTEIVVEP